MQKQLKMNWKNKLIKALIFFFRKRKLPFSSNKHFLIVSTTGLGDTLWGTPAIRELKTSYPQAKISLLTSSLGKEVLKNNPHIDAFYVVSDSLLSFFGPLRSLRKEQISAALIFHTSQRFALPLCTLCSIPTIIGTRGLNKGLDSLLTHTMEPKRQHEVERRLSMVREAGATISNRSLEMHWTQEDEKRLIDSQLPLVGIHPGAKDRFKQYPPDYFVRLGRELMQRFGCRIVITGGPQEKDLVETIRSRIEGAIPLAGGLSISELAAQIQRFSLFVTNDTGPMHLAFAVDTPTVALFCPTDPALCGPYHAKRVKVLSKPRTCTPCLKKKCQDPFCLRQIPLHSIINAAEELTNGY